MPDKHNLIMSSKNNSQKVWTLLTWAIIVTLIINGCGTTPSPKVYHVGILSGLDYFANTIDGFKTKMTELGYIENENIVYDVQQVDMDLAAYKSVLEKFVADKVDLIFVFPTEAALEAKSITQGSDIPVLFANSFTEGVDLIESVREPGGNITGVRYPGPDLAAKSLEILLEIAPQTKRVGVPYLQDYPSVPNQLEAMRSVATSLGVTLVEIPATSVTDVQAGLQAQAQSTDSDLDAILFINEPLGTWPDVIAAVTEFAAKHQIPVGNDALFLLIVDNVEVGRQAATLADKILKGTPAGTLPVLSPEPFLQINYKVAQELGLTVPEGLLKQADKIIR